jgi:hypothetical protein
MSMRVQGATPATAAALFSLLCALPATAEPPQQLSAAPGVPVPLMVENGARPDCTIGAPPEMTVILAPAHGELTLREGELKRRGSACPASPGYVVLYVPDADFNGPDNVTLELSDGRTPVTLAFDIEVKGKITRSVEGV